MSENWKLNDRIQDRYEIKRIKRGGMGVVFLCYDRHKNIAVAIKTFQDRYLLDDHSKRRFLAEGIHGSSSDGIPILLKRIQLKASIIVRTYSWNAWRGPIFLALI